jgi:hypothetical protein
MNKNVYQSKVNDSFKYLKDPVSILDHGWVTDHSYHFKNINIPQVSKNGLVMITCKTLVE